METPINFLRHERIVRCALIQTIHDLQYSRTQWYKATNRKSNKLSVEVYIMKTSSSSNPHIYLWARWNRICRSWHCNPILASPPSQLGQRLEVFNKAIRSIYKDLGCSRQDWGAEAVPVPRAGDCKRESGREGKFVIWVTLYSALHSIDTTRCDWIQRRVTLHNIQCDCNVTLATVSSPYILPLKIGHWVPIE